MEYFPIFNTNMKSLLYLYYRMPHCSHKWRFPFKSYRIISLPCHKILNILKSESLLIMEGRKTPPNIASDPCKHPSIEIYSWCITPIISRLENLFKEHWDYLTQNDVGLPWIYSCWFNIPREPYYIGHR